jgi:hypothetical protein
MLAFKMCVPSLRKMQESQLKLCSVIGAKGVLSPSVYFVSRINCA